MDFNHRTVVIAGSSGLGATVATALSRRLKSRGAARVLVGAPIASGDPILHDLGRIDALINLVDIAPCFGSPSGRSADEVIAEACNVAIGSTSALFESVREPLQAGIPHGFVVNVALLRAGSELTTPHAVTAITRAIEALSRAMAHEWAPEVRVNTVLFDEEAALRSARFATGNDDAAAEDIAFGPILFLASDAARHMTGTTLIADAGKSLGFSGLAQSLEAAA